MKAYYASETALFLGARPCSDVLAAAFNEQPAFACAHTRLRHRTLSLGRSAACTVAACACRAALVGAGFYPL